MKLEQYTYWSMTLNNPEDNDWVMIRNPNEKYIRSLVWTREIGEGGTEHIQAWVRLQRNNSMSFMKKLYPRGHFRFIDKDEYNENTQQYAQKEDETTAGLHHITLHDPLPANDTLLYRVLDEAFIRLCDIDPIVQEAYDECGPTIFLNDMPLTLKKLDLSFVERKMVTERAGLEKIFCSPAYEKMKTTFWKYILYRIYKQKDAEYQDTQTTPSVEYPSQGDSESHQECDLETYEGSSESSGDEISEESDG